MMTLRQNKVIVDASFLYEFLNRQAPRHEKAAVFVRTFQGQLVLPEVALTETAYLFDRINGVMGVIQFLDALQLFNPTIEHMNRADLRRAREIMERFKDARQLDFVDCCIVAIAERVETDLVCTFDYRDFQIVRMKNNQPMNILPTPNSRA